MMVMDQRAIGYFNPCPRSEFVMLLVMPGLSDLLLVMPGLSDLLLVMPGLSDLPCYWSCLGCLIYLLMRSFVMPKHIIDIYNLM